jgi:hypothetical protein
MVRHQQQNRHRMHPEKRRAETLLILKFFVFLAETLDSAGGVHQFLFAGEKRMAFGANFHADVFLCRPHLDRVAAGTLDRGF